MMILRGFALLVLTLVLVTPIMAQDEDELPVVEGGVINWYAESIFPQAIRFFVAFEGAIEEIRTATLTFQPENGPEQTIRLDLDQALVIGATFTDLEYIWEVTPETAPDLFTDVIYEWRAEYVNGDESFVRDRITFRDEHIEWIQSPDPLDELDLVVPATGPTPDEIRQRVLLPVNLISANTGLEPNFRAVLAYPDLDLSGCVADEDDALVTVKQKSDTTLPCDPEVATQIYNASGYDVVYARSATTTGAESALIEYLVNRLYESLWAGKSVPEWFRVGLTQFYLPMPEPRLLSEVRAADRTNQLYEPDSLQFDGANSTALAQSYGMVLYIADTIGLPGLYDLARVSGDNFDAAYTAAMGQPLNALLSNFRRWIFSSAADDAFVFSPYRQSSTATPTATVTMTLTSTLTPSPTDTPTPTATVTGELSSTPRPTATATRTSTAAPATITPRPAGSLFTPTPLPPANPLDNPQTQTTLLILVIIGVVGVAVILFLLNRDRGW